VASRRVEIILHRVPYSVQTDCTSATSSVDFCFITSERIIRNVFEIKMYINIKLSENHTQNSTCYEFAELFSGVSKLLYLRMETACYKNSYGSHRLRTVKPVNSAFQLHFICPSICVYQSQSVR
jgi:hypothetical protein